jgi:diaminopimelate epimerase
MRPGTVFYKMTGSGNDFVMFDGRYAYLEEFTPETIRALCDRRHGVGADGVILLDPGAPAGTHFAFHFWNSDGSPGPMCGNGALCAVRLAALIELAPATDEVRFVTPVGVHRGRVVGSESEIVLPDCDTPKPAAVPTAAGERAPLVCSPSVPHLVLQVDDVEPVPLLERGPGLRHHPTLGPEGANVNWVAPVGDGTFRMRTYERGVEAETLSCGTGAVACALALEEQGLARSPVTIWTRSRMPLVVAWELNERGATSIRLKGEGRLVFRGIVGDIVRPKQTQA